MRNFDGDGPMKRSIFQNRWLPYLLLAPQLVVVIVFFFWPAFDSLRLSFFKVAPFGDREIFVGLGNFIELLTAPEYGRSVVYSFIFSLGVTGPGAHRFALSGQPRQPEDPGPPLLPDRDPLDLRDRAPGVGHHLALHLSSELRGPPLPALLGDDL